MPRIAPRRHLSHARAKPVRPTFDDDVRGLELDDDDLVEFFCPIVGWMTLAIGLPVGYWYRPAAGIGLLVFGACAAASGRLWFRRNVGGWLLAENIAARAAGVVLLVMAMFLLLGRGPLAANGSSDLPPLEAGNSFLRAAQAAYEEGDLNRAIEQARRALLAEPGDGDIHAMLADLYLEQARRRDRPDANYEDIPEALEHLQRAAAAKPTDSDLATKLYRAQRRSEQARDTLQEVDFSTLSTP